MGHEGLRVPTGPNIPRMRGAFTDHVIAERIAQAIVERFC
jgi:hypothetical protein